MGAQSRLGNEMGGTLGSWAGRLEGSARTRRLRAEPEEGVVHG